MASEKNQKGGVFGRELVLRKEMSGWGIIYAYDKGNEVGRKRGVAGGKGKNFCLREKKKNRVLSEGQLRSDPRVRGKSCS